MSLTRKTSTRCRARSTMIPLLTPWPTLGTPKVFVWHSRGSRGFFIRSPHSLTRVARTIMHPLIEQHRGEIARLCRRYAVRRLEIFDSAARDTDFDPVRSDADFLVDFEPGSGLRAVRQFFGLAEALEQLLRRHVDLVEPRAIRNPYLRASIDKAREVVHGS